MCCNKSPPSSPTRIGLNAAQSRDPLVNTSFLIAGADCMAVNLRSRQLCRNLRSGSLIKGAATFRLFREEKFSTGGLHCVQFFILCSLPPFTLNHFLACEKCKYSSGTPFCSLALTPPSAPANSFSLPDMEPCAHGDSGPPATGHAQTPR